MRWMAFAKTPTLWLVLCSLVACDGGGGGGGSTSSGETTGSAGESTALAETSSGVDTTDPGSTSGATSTGEDSDETGGETSSSTGGGSSTTTGSSSDPVALSAYEPLGPEVTLPGPGNNASGVTWNYDTDRVWVVQNGSSRFFEYPADDFSSPIRVVDLAGINAHDTEGLAYMGGGEVAIAFEGGYGVYIADVPDGDTDVSVGVKQTLVLAPPPPVGNNGLEGIAYDPDAQVFYAVGEGQDEAAPRRFFRVPRPAVTEGDFDWMDPELQVDEPFVADDVLPESGASLDLAGVAFDPRDGNVLIVSHTGSRVLQLDPAGDGTILDTFVLEPNQWEGVALVGASHDLVLIAESNELQRFGIPTR